MGVTTAYYLSSTNSDLSGGADFTKKLTKSTESASTIACSIAGSATETSYGFTALGDPSFCGRRGARPFTVKVNVTVLNTNIQISVQLARVNSAGTVQNTKAASAEQSAGTTGVKTFSFTDVDLGEFGDQDRLRVSYIFRNTNAGVQSVTIGTGTSSEQVTAPWITTSFAHLLMNRDKGQRLVLQALVEGLTDPIGTDDPPDKRTKTYAIDFDGTNDHVACGTDTALTQLADVTILLWVKIDSLAATRVLAGAFDDTSGNGYHVRVNTSGQIVVRHAAGAVIATFNNASDPLVSAGAWTYIAVSVGGDARTVVEGLVNDTRLVRQDFAVSRASRGTWTASTPFALGAAVNVLGTVAFPLDGRMGYAAILNRGCTPEEMKRLKYRFLTAAWGNKDSDGLWDKCVAQYDFERGSGTNLVNTRNPGTHDGTLTSGPTWQSDACFTVTYRPVLSIDTSFGQEVEPLGTSSSISGFTLRVLDEGEWFTTALKTASGHLLRRQIVLHLGLRGLMESEYQRILVGTIERIRQDGGSYILQVKDALFGAKKRITLGKTTLQAALNAGVTASLSVAVGNYFFDAEDIAANQLLQIEDEALSYDSDSLSSASAFTLDSLARGQLGTTDATHASGTVVKEIWQIDTSLTSAVYLPLYFLLSGAGLERASAYDYFAEVTWTNATTRVIRGRGAGMSPSDVAVADFDALYNAEVAFANITLGIFVTEDVENIKDFLEREVLRALGCFFYTKFDGRVSMARVKAPTASDVTASLSPHQMRVRGWELSQDDIVNFISVEYSWNPVQGYVNQYIATDASSVARYGLRKREYSLKGHHSSTFLDTWRTNLFARFAIPYIEIEAICGLAELFTDVGDTVRLTSFNLPNLTTGLRGIHDQLWQVSGKKVDLKRGQITFTLADMSRS